jgi:hypothetical protein
LRDGAEFKDARVMWSKIPKPGGKGLRCKIYVQRNGEMLPCDRPARRYGQQVKAFWNEGQLMDTGCIDCCENHAMQLRKQAVILTLIDRRRTANP